MRKTLKPVKPRLVSPVRLQREPLRPVAPRELAALQDPDARENYAHYLALRDEARSRPAMRAAQALGYVPNPAARALTSSRSNLVAVVIPSLSNSVFVDTVEAIQRVLMPAGFEMMIGVSHYRAEEDERLLRFVFPERPGALLKFLSLMRPGWNISLFHYRNQGADYGRILVNSCFTLSLMVGVSVGDTTLGTAIANLGWDEVRFPAPVFVGDTLRVETEVIDVCDSKSRPEAGIVTFAHRAYNQNGTLVASCKRSGLQRRKPV